MNVITLKDLKEIVRRQYIENTTENFVLAELKDFPDDTKIVVLSYCDYGGSLVDKALIRLFKDKYKDNILVKDTHFYGELAYIYPTSKSTEYSDNVVIQLIEDSEDYPLGFDCNSLEEYFSEAEDEIIQEYLEVFYDDLKRNENYVVVGRKNNWVQSAAICLYGEIDVSVEGVMTKESRIIEILIKNKLLIKKSL